MKTILVGVDGSTGSKHAAYTSLELGHPADVILEQAKALEVDHIAVGARGLSAGSRWLLGSVGDRVVHHAHCPVTVVR